MAHNFGSNVNFNKNELQNTRAHNLAAAPSNPATGQFYYDTVNNIWRVYSGAAWIDLASLVALLATRLDQFAVPAADVSFGGVKITNVADPVAGTDAVNLQFVRGLIDGLKWKDAVRVATTGNVALTGLQTIDGITLIAGDRIAVIANTAGAENGIYVAASGAWARSSDASTAAEVTGLTVAVLEGTANGNKLYTQTADSVTLGTTALVFSLIGSSGTSYTAGTGISIAGNVIAADFAVVARKVVALIGNGSLTSITVPHNLGTKAVTVGLRKVSTDELWIPDVTASTTNNVTLAFTTAPTTNEFEVVVIG